MYKLVADIIANSRRPSLRALPDGYTLKRAIDFSQGRWVLLLNLLGVPLLLASGALFALAATWAHPEGFLRADSRLCFPVVGACTLAILLHELVHGAGFWLFTGARPKFGLSPWGAYAGAPDWYLPRNRHLIIGLAPFVLISVLGVLLLFLIPASWVFGVVVGLALNAGGAIGDLLTCLFELFEPPGALIRDTGMTITIYRRS